MQSCSIHGRRVPPPAWASLIIAAALLAWPHAAHAADDQQAPTRLTEFSLEQLGDIEVTSVSKRPEEVRRTPVAIHVITHDDIRRSGATSIPEVLRLAPGIEVARIDSDHWSIGVRGFGDQFSKALLVLIDGRSIYTPLFAGTYWPAHDALLDNIERIEVIRGPGGTIWGADAVSGVINIITKSAADTHGVSITTGAGSIDRGIAGLRLGGGNGSTFDYRVYGKAVSRGAEHHADAATFDEWWSTQAGFRTDWRRSGSDTITVQGDVSKGNHGQRVSVASFSPAAQVPLDGVLDALGANLRAQWQRDFPGGDGFRLQAYVDRTRWTAPHFGERRTTFDVDFVHHLPLGQRHTLSSGAGSRISPSTFIQAVPTLDFTPRSDTSSVYSAFIQDEFVAIRDRFWITAGSRVEHDSYTGFEAQPSIRALWTPTPGSSVWSAVTRAVRTPSRIEDAVVSTSYSTTTIVPIFLRVTGNPDFEAERMLGYEAGYRTQLGAQAHLDVAAFHNHHTGLASYGLGQVTIEQTPAPVHAVVDVLPVNGVSGTSDGFEVSPGWQLRSWWQVRGAYSYVRFNLANTPGSIDVNAVNRYDGSSPHHQVRLESHINVGHAGELDTVYRYVGPLAALVVPAYHTADVRIGWAVSPRAQVSLAGQNLLSPYHVEFAHTPGPAVGIARSVYLEFNWRFANARP
ncbi:MAG TPA: TonB-dependent receptor [Vicinamibacterales bacterium]|nr:TonB-dependent receptor [Vicinamibacterales bacterium]